VTARRMALCLVGLVVAVLALLFSTPFGGQRPREHAPAPSLARTYRTSPCSPVEADVFPSLGYREVALSPEPPPGLKDYPKPRDRRARFGLIHWGPEGDGREAAFLIDVWSDGFYWRESLFLDTNQDGSLTDEAETEAEAGEDLVLDGSPLSVHTTDLDFPSAPLPRAVELRGEGPLPCYAAVAVQATETRDYLSLQIGRELVSLRAAAAVCAVVGAWVELGGSRVLVVAVDGDGDGRFAGPDEAMLPEWRRGPADFMGVDFDGDGRITGSPARGAPSELVDGPYLVWRGECVELGVSPDGAEIGVARYTGPSGTLALPKVGRYYARLCDPDGKPRVTVVGTPGEDAPCPPGRYVVSRASASTVYQSLPVALHVGPLAACDLERARAMPTQPAEIEVRRGEACLVPPRSPLRAVLAARVCEREGRHEAAISWAFRDETGALACAPFTGSARPGPIVQLVGPDGASIPAEVEWSGWDAERGHALLTHDVPPPGLYKLRLTFQVAPFADAPVQGEVALPL
jgi:hypothetical protein